MNNSTKNLGLALGAAFAASLVAAPVAQAFQVQDLQQGYQLVDDHKDDEPKEDKEGACGEGKCGEGKCGEGKCGGAA